MLLYFKNVPASQLYIMSSEIDIDIVRGYYSKMSDQEIMLVLTTDAKGLTTEALQVIQEEI